MQGEREQKKHIIAVVGPTASGKSALADFLVSEFGGIVVNADSRQVYRGMSVVTAAAMTDASHKLYQFLNLDEPFSFAQYVELADSAIAAASEPVFVVGGTGLYVDALARMTGAAPRVPAEVRARVMAMGAHGAREELLRVDAAAAAKIDLKNPRRVARALEVFLATGKSILQFGARDESPYEIFWVGWNPGREAVLQRIRARVLESWDAMVAEVRVVREKFAADAPGMQTIGVPEICEFLDGKLSAADAQELLITHTAQYAKRQMTWFKRNKKIVWYTDSNEVCQSLRDFLRNDFQKS